MAQRSVYKNFGAAPANYVAGAGRGAIGFTTRSDIGPARQQNKADAPKEQLVNESNYDKEFGYGGSLFANESATSEDLEADAIYEAIDKRMDSKRSARRVKRYQDTVAQHGKRMKIEDQFADAKRDLAQLTEDDWMNIPDVKNMTRAKKQTSRWEKETAVPDHIIDSARRGLSHNTDISTSLDGVETPASGTGSVDLTALGSARDQHLQTVLDSKSDSVTGQTVVDTKGYMTDLQAISSNSTDISDIRRGRKLLGSVIKSNPKHAPGWIAAARLEEAAGKHAKAQKMIMEGCDACPNSEDMWLEAARLHPPAIANSILARAVRQIPKSVKLWMKASALERGNAQAQKAILRRALEFIPNSIQLWKSAVELENPNDARIMLSRAVECVPKAVDMWLALARLETYTHARLVLNKARMHLPGEPSIWVTASNLEETHGNHKMVDKIISKAIKSLAAAKVVIDREQWLEEAANCEAGGHPKTCDAIVRHTIGMGVAQEDQRNVWLEDTKPLVKKGHIETARSVFSHMMKLHKGKSRLWWEFAKFEKQHGSHESLMALLREAVENCPTSANLWLLTAKQLWLSGDVSGARDILTDAFAANPNSEQIWLAAVKLEAENDEPERARHLLDKARKSCGTARVWMKSAVLERSSGNSRQAAQYLEEATRRFKDQPKLWLMLANLHASQGDVAQARTCFSNGVKFCAFEFAVWLEYAEFEAAQHKVNSLSKARSILESARRKIPKCPELWLAGIRLEEQNEATKKNAKAMQARALKECPGSGLLWAHAIATEIRPQRKRRSHDALTKCPDNAHVFLAVAKLFWADRKSSKAKKWFERAVEADSDLGDAWAYYLVFVREQLGKEYVAPLVKRCQEADPRHGEQWIAISKKIGNERLTTEQVLTLVADAVPKTK